MQKVIGYKFPEKPQHLGLKIESILRKRLNKVKFSLRSSTHIPVSPVVL